MAYLPRQERQTEILEAVIQIAAEDGLDAATVRRVSAQLGMSSGNLHHLFGSAAELKRAAFRLFAEREIAALDAGANAPDPFDQLLAYLATVAVGTDLPSRRVWQSAGHEAARDPAFAALWAEKTDVWLNRVTDLLFRLSNPLAPRDAVVAAAWRLMSFAVGVTSFAEAAGYGVDPATIPEHIKVLIHRELDALRSVKLQTV